MSGHMQGAVATEYVTIGWAEALQEQFGSTPWWVVSSAAHIIVLLILTLITVGVPEMNSNAAIIPMELARPVEIKDEPTERAVFNNSRRIEAPNEVEHPVIVHEEVDELDHIETDNNCDARSARGQEDAISEIPLGGTGVVGNIGLSGGGAGAFGFRTGGRLRAAIDGGGSPISERGVDSALRWLVRHQERDGRWDGEAKYEASDPGEDSDPGVTGLALLAFLGAGHTEKTGEHKTTVVRAVSWLRKNQAKDGCIGRGYAGGLGYHHAIAGLALAEAYGMANVESTRRAAQLALDYSLKTHQSEYSGWRYEPNTPSDMSVTGWFVMQLKSATVAGLRVDAKGMQGAAAFLDECTQERSYPGLVSYQPGRSPTHTMTSVGLLCRQFMGWGRTDPVLVGSANYLKESLPEWSNGSVNFYYWYYGTLAMYQMGGGWWKAWNGAMRDMLVDRQRKGPPSVDGSWDPVCVWNAKGGRVYSTALGALCLEVYYRYLPLYRATNNPRSALALNARHSQRADRRDESLETILSAHEQSLHDAIDKDEADDIGGAR